MNSYINSKVLAESTPLSGHTRLVRCYDREFIHTHPPPTYSTASDLRPYAGAEIFRPAMTDWIGCLPCPHTRRISSSGHRSRSPSNAQSPIAQLVQLRQNCFFPTAGGRRHVYSHSVWLERQGASRPSEWCFANCTTGDMHMQMWCSCAECVLSVRTYIRDVHRFGSLSLSVSDTRDGGLLHPNCRVMDHGLASRSPC
jgi:hypothetical protein